MSRLSKSSGLYRGYFDSPIGTIEILANKKEIVHIHFTIHKETSKENELVVKTKEWFEGYFAKNVHPFTLPLIEAKNSFSKIVREVVQDIPFGACLSYQEVAKRSGNAKAAQAVGQIMKRNPYAIVVPCHRVISKQGIGGYNGGIEIKKALLEFEGCESISL
ncbi:methylated-DNA--[protein]-cysteine S-methyltransferase [Nitratiruptor sp. SB155-2]|uniref:methylated-DNA--[protein]-cysteine S-methyltransferase n=1 Tax=Nitratiruptor sp. (strain SB155-2) TaxID=387092 RepID=UPI000158700A|nr:methylated-DNA--[protein]-cysteine S-methyltransferase [Nitratiruptor sp. SB155-2]BAF69959.1 methylated-DNA-[protein]-cysteine S-methyltransferase [Nitratiruptor sp. SB155-2]